MSRLVAPAPRQARHRGRHIILIYTCVIVLHCSRARAGENTSFSYFGPRVVPWCLTGRQPRRRAAVPQPSATACRP